MKKMILILTAIIGLTASCKKKDVAPKVIDNGVVIKVEKYKTSTLSWPTPNSIYVWGHYSDNGQECNEMPEYILMPMIVTTSKLKPDLIHFQENNIHPYPVRFKIFANDVLLKDTIMQNGYFVCDYKNGELKFL